MKLWCRFKVFSFMMTIRPKIFAFQCNLFGEVTCLRCLSDNSFAQRSYLKKASKGSWFKYAQSSLTFTKFLTLLIEISSQVTFCSLLLKKFISRILESQSNWLRRTKRNWQLGLKERLNTWLLSWSQKRHVILKLLIIRLLMCGHLVFHCIKFLT